jgi:hypothetical protein
MRIIVAIVAFALAVCVNAQQPSTQLELPHDNGSTVSFSKSLRMMTDDPCPIQCLVWALSESKKMLWTRCCPSQGWMEGELLFSIKGHEVTCLIEAFASNDTMGYHFSCYRIDGIQLDKWVSDNPGVLAERIKSTVFAETVLTIVEMRKATSA